MTAVPALPAAFIDTIDDVGSILEEQFTFVPDIPARHRCAGLDELDANDLDRMRAHSERAWADNLVGRWSQAARDEAITRQMFDQGWQQRVKALRRQAAGTP